MTAEVERVVAAVAAELAVDRCWLYARDPSRGRGIALVRWLRTAATLDVPAELWTWNDEAPDLPALDPRFARALAGAPLEAVDDVAAGGNPDLERTLGHRAFIHVNLHAGGRLWGTLQPGMTDAPRAWTAADREVARRVREELARAVAALVSAHGERLQSRRLVSRTA